MKRTVLLSCILSCQLLAARAQVSPGIRAGYTAADMRISGETSGDLGVPDNLLTTYHGWHLELYFHIPVTRGLYAATSLKYVTKGAGFKELPSDQKALTGMYVPASSDIRLNYLELPVGLVYKLPVGRSKITFGAGGFISRGLNGSYTFDMVQDGVSLTQHSKKVQFSRKDDDNVAVLRMKPWEAGLDFSLGYEFFSGFTLGANYNLGLTDTDRNDYTSTRNKYFGISLGFIFNREDY